LLQHLEKAIEISQQMLRDGKDENWQAFEAQQQQRQLLLNQCRMLTAELDREASLQAEQHLIQLKKLDAQLLALANQQQEVLKGAFSSRQKGKRMTKAYLANR